MSPIDSADPSPPESSSLPRRRKFLARLFGDLEFGRKSLAWLAVVLGVIAPVLGFRLFMIVFPDRSMSAAVMLFAVSCMLVLLAWTFARPKSPKLAALLAGALWIATGFGAAFTLAASPIWLMTIVMQFNLLFGQTQFRGDMSLRYAAMSLLTLIPLLGTLVYLIYARRATVAARGAPGGYLALGVFVPVVVSCAAYAGLISMRERCIRAMLSEDPQSALAAADDCRCLNPVVSWQPIVDAYLEARDRDPSAEDDVCSAPIAVVYQRLTGVDLRAEFDDSADY